MAAKKVGELIKEARTGAGLTQEKLAAAVGLVASDISKAERGELDLTDAALKKIAKATGVTQVSLLSAPKGGATAKPAASKTSTTKTAATKAATSKAATTKATTTKAATAKTTTTKATTAKAATTKATTAKATTKAAPAKTPANADVSMKVTSTEKKLIEYYRAASSDEKKAATKVLKGECPDLLASIIGGGTNAMADNVADLLGDVVGSLLGMKK